MTPPRSFAAGLVIVALGLASCAEKRSHRSSGDEADGERGEASTSARPEHASSSVPDRSTRMPRGKGSPKLTVERHDATDPLLKTTLRQSLQGGREPFMDCYASALARDPTAGGSVTIAFELAETSPTPTNVVSTEETTFTDPEMVTCVLAAFRTVKLLPSAAKGSVRLGFRPGAPGLPLSLRTVGSDAKVGGAPAKRATLKDIAAALERAGLREVVVTEADSATRACGRVRARRDADEVTVFFYPDIAASDGPRLAPDDLDQYKRSGAIVTDQTFLVAAVFSSGKVSAARALLREIVSGEDVEK